MDELNELEWISQFFDNEADMDSEGLERVKNFTFLWNMFERFACSKFATVASIKVFVTKLRDNNLITAELIEPYLEYFIERYSNADNLINIEGLRFRPAQDELKTEVIKVLSRETVQPSLQLEALLLILLRLRNNLFHGEKDILLLNTQISNFKYANRLLANVLDVMKANNMINH